ncbi:MAG: DNA topoisomerase, partial [Oscillospiraceae bacterium]
KLLTYPRTDSSYITEDMAAEMTERVKMLRFFDEGAVDDLLISGLNIDSRVVNNKKVSDHHAIIPTENISSINNLELSDEEKSILEMVITRFLAVFCKEYQYNETEYIFEVNGEMFHNKFKAPVQLGWKRFYFNSEGKDEDIISYTQGESFEAKNLEIVESETQPPKAYTEATLLRAMENIDRRIEDKELSEYVKKRGLGTPATRANTIERVITVGYIERVNKTTLKSTSKGRKVIDMLPDDVKNIEMTAEMEQQLAAIEKGEESAESVVAQTIEKVQRVIEYEKTRKHVSLAAPRESLGKCPKCGGAVYVSKLKNGSIIYYCEHSSQKLENPCIFRVFADDLFWKSKKKTLGEKTMQTLLTKGKVKVKGLYSEKKNKTYDATILFGDDWTDKQGNAHIGFTMEFDKSSPQKEKKGGK